MLVTFLHKHRHKHSMSTAISVRFLLVTLKQTLKLPGAVETIGLQQEGRAWRELLHLGGHLVGTRAHGAVSDLLHGGHSAVLHLLGRLLDLVVRHRGALLNLVARLVSSLPHCRAGLQPPTASSCSARHMKLTCNREDSKYGWRWHDVVLGMSLPLD